LNDPAQIKPDERMADDAAAVCLSVPGQARLAAALNTDKDNLTRNDRIEQLPAAGDGAQARLDPGFALT
jgi:hypothetical protein